MKRYNIEVLGANILVRVIRTKPHETVLNIQYGEGREDEQEIILPAKLLKKQFTDNAFARHILNFFIKE